MSLRLRDQRGFTLVELMIVVALIAVLAAIVIPTFTGEVRNVRADSEISAVFAEIRVKEENFKLENGRYAAMSVFPAVPSPQLQPFQAALPADWIAIKFIAPQLEARCSYETFAGAGGDATPAAAQAAPFNVPAAPTTAWYVVIANCDLDGSAALNGMYVTSSLNNQTLSVNPGR